MFSPRPPFAPLLLFVAFVTCIHAGSITDIALVVDSSASVTSLGFSNESKFIQTAVSSELPLGQSQISLTEFSTAIDEIISPLTMLDSSSESSLIQKIQRMSYLAEATHTLDAVQAAINLLAADSTTTDPKFLLLITDGAPFPVTQTPCSLKTTLDGDGITALIVGFGPSFAVSDVSCLVNDTSQQIFTLSSVDPTTTVGMQAEAWIGSSVNSTPEPQSAILFLAAFGTLLIRSQTFRVATKGR